MGTWQNADGLWIRLGPDEADNAIGGQYGDAAGLHEIEFDLAWNDLTSATNVLPRTTDSFGIVIPAGARIEEVETVIRTAFTSSGTIASATLTIGLNENNRTTAISNTALLSAAANAQLGWATAGTKNVVRVGSTGAGASIGTTLSQQGVVTVCNPQHASHPLTAGAMKVRVRYYFP